MGLHFKITINKSISNWTLFNSTQIPKINQWISGSLADWLSWYFCHCFEEHLISGIGKHPLKWKNKKLSSSL